MREDGGAYTHGARPEDMLARKLSKVGLLMREQEWTEAELDPSFAGG